MTQQLYKNIFICIVYSIHLHIINLDATRDSEIYQISPIDVVVLTILLVSSGDIALLLGVGGRRGW